MRTTLSIDDDVLVAVKGLAAAQHRSAGEVLSLLARQALQSDMPVNGLRNGVPLLSHKGGVMPATLELVNQLRDELP